MYTTPLVTTNTERTVKLYSHLHMQQAKKKYTEFISDKLTLQSTKSRTNS